MIQSPRRTWKLWARFSISSFIFLLWDLIIGPLLNQISTSSIGYTRNLKIWKFKFFSATSSKISLSLPTSPKIQLKFNSLSHKFIQLCIGLTRAAAMKLLDSRFSVVHTLAEFSFMKCFHSPLCTWLRRRQSSREEERKNEEPSPLCI